MAVIAGRGLGCVQVGMRVHPHDAETVAGAKSQAQSGKAADGYRVVATNHDRPLTSSQAGRHTRRDHIGQGARFEQVVQAGVLIVFGMLQVELLLQRGRDGLDAQPAVPALQKGEDRLWTFEQPRLVGPGPGWDKQQARVSRGGGPPQPPTAAGARPRPAPPGSAPLLGQPPRS